jgi:4-amino-4-deoxy-L-arabinose transferase-like glycosyltransferase
VAVAETPTRIAVRRSDVARAELIGLAAGVVVLLVSVAGRYGYHRDELYFLRAGREPAFGYVDQPPLSPLLAHAADALFGGSLVGLRLPSALAAGLTVLCTGLIARELGGGRAAQVLAAACMAVSSILLGTGHLLSTTTFDLLAWTVLSWLVVKGLRVDGPVWLAVGVVAGVALQNKTLPLFLLGAVTVGVVLVGPRATLRSGWVWSGGLIALALWAPNLVWQAAHGFPLLTMSRAIAAGSSGTSEPWYVFLPFQLLLISPLLAPIWMIGWWHLARDPALRPWRAFAVAYVLLAVVLAATGGKPYYLAGLYPVLLAAGAAPVVRWVADRAPRTRGSLLGAALVLSLAVSAFLVLPLVPVDKLARTPVPSVYYDAGETVGWPELAVTVADVRDRIPPDQPTAVLTANYGEAGAVDRFLPQLAPAYSGHNAYGTWGPPPEHVATLIVVGFPEQRVREWFGDVELAARVDNGVGLDNDEQNAPVWIGRRRRASWDVLWSQLVRLG